jgi:hypothetical protein
VEKHVLASVERLNEAESARGIEKLKLALLHVGVSVLYWKCLILGGDPATRQILDSAERHYVMTRV